MVSKPKQVEARSAVNVQMKAWDIAKAGRAITLKVKDRDKLVGTIEIGQGTFGWRGAHGKSGFKRIPWAQFGALLEDT